jgi:CheY-like chemotaxis protein
MPGRDWSHKVILIAEDEMINYLFLKAVFDKTGAKILWARNTQETMTMCGAQKIDLLLIDLQMAGSDGRETARKIKEINPDISVIAQTAYHGNQDREEALEAGCDSYLTKPVKPKNLLATVERYI